MKKICIIIIGVLVCFLGCNKRDEQVVRIAYTPTLGPSQLYVGIAKGYFEEEGIKLEMSQFHGGAPDIVPAILGKSVDIGFPVVPSLIMARTNGVKIKSIGGCSFDSEHILEHRIMLPIDSEIKTAQDLRGKKIAVLAEGTSDYFSLLNYLKTNGIKKEDVEIVSVPFTEMIFALTSKSVDAAASTEPFITMGALEKKTKTFDYFYPIQDIEIVTAVAHEDFINDNPEIIAKFSRAIDRATNFINNEQEEFRKLLPTLGEYGIKFKISKEVADSFTILGYKSSITPAGVEAVMDMMIENNVLKTKIDAEDIIYSPK